MSPLQQQITFFKKFKSQRRNKKCQILDLIQLGVSSHSKTTKNLVEFHYAVEVLEPDKDNLAYLTKPYVSVCERLSLSLSLSLSLNVTYD